MSGAKRKSGSPSGGKQSGAEATIAQQEIAGHLGDEALVAASSASIFGRGKTYATSGAVEMLAPEAERGPRIRATVHGTKAYSVAVWIEDDGVEGDCDCPHAGDGWFCKHQVALAIVWRDRLSGRETPIDETARRKVATSAKRAQTVERRRNELETFLRERSSSELAARLFELSEREPWIARELKQWREIESQSARPAEWKRLVTEILSTGRDFLGWDECARYVSRAEAVLPLLRRAREHDAEAGVKLAIHALRRAWSAIGNADDSNGEIGGLCTAIGSEFAAAAQRAGPQPAAFGESYLQLLMDDPFGCFDANAVEASMGAAATARFERELASRWRRAKDEVLRLRASEREAASKRSGTVRDFARSHRGRDDAEWSLNPLESLHLGQLEKRGDLEGVLAVLREDLDTPEGSDRVTCYLEKHERFREAFANAEQAFRRFPEDWRLERSLLRCYERDGWHEEAFQIRRRQFEREPNVEGYRAVLKAGAAAGRDAVGLRAELMRWLESLERDEYERERQNVSYAFRPRGHRTGESERAPRRDVSRRAAILCAEGRWEEAGRLVASPAVCDYRILGQIAVRLDAGRGDEILSLGRRAVEAAMKHAGSPYRAELDLARAIGDRVDPKRRSIWWAELKDTYRAKRNFVAGIPNA